MTTESDLFNVTCWGCSGTGRNTQESCLKCQGSGRVFWVNGIAFPYSPEGEKAARQSLTPQARIFELVCGALIWIGIWANIAMLGVLVIVNICPRC